MMFSGPRYSGRTGSRVSSRDSLVNNERRSQRQIATSCLMVMLLMGCDSSDAMQDETDLRARAGTRADSGAAGQSAGADGGTSGNTGVTFTSLYENEMKTCRIDFCHGGGRANLNMATKESALATLVNQPADPPSPCGCRDAAREAGDPERAALSQARRGHAVWRSDAWAAAPR